MLKRMNENAYSLKAFLLIVFLWTGVRCPVVPQLVIEIVLTADGL